MNDTIINGIFTLSGVVIGGLISYLITKSNRDYKRLKSVKKELCHQIISYWNLEKLYSEELANKNSKPARTIQIEYRNKIENMNFKRPTMTAKDARKHLDKN